MDRSYAEDYLDIFAHPAVEPSNTDSGRERWIHFGNELDGMITLRALVDAAGRSFDYDALPVAVRSDVLGLQADIWIRIYDLGLFSFCRIDVGFAAGECKMYRYDIWFVIAATSQMSKADRLQQFDRLIISQVFDLDHNTSSLRVIIYDNAISLPFESTRPIQKHLERQLQSIGVTRRDRKK